VSAKATDERKTDQASLKSGAVILVQQQSRYRPTGQRLQLELTSNLSTEQKQHDVMPTASLP
jgi:hypothetical protein